MTVGPPLPDGWRVVGAPRLSRTSEWWVAGSRDGAAGVVKRLLPIHKDDPTLRAAFLREVDLAPRLDHPNLPRALHWSGGEERLPWVLYERLDGATLEALVQTEGPLSCRAALAIARAVAAALVALGAVRRADGGAQVVAHRDVAPQNILVRHDGRAALIDFGLVADAAAAAEGGAVGTWRYAAPEQLAGAPVGSAVDIYGLGASLAFSVTGAPPYDGLRGLTELREAKAAGPLRIDAPSTLRDLVMECTAPSPSDRPASAQALLRHLEALL